jgi:hypothetical protein
VIKGARVYVKYNAQEFPGSDFSKYDKTVSADTNLAHSHIEGMKCGKYFFICYGI